MVWRVSCPVLGIVLAIGVGRGVLDLRRGDITVAPGLAYPTALSALPVLLLTGSVAYGYFVEVAALIYLVGLGLILAVAIISFGALIFREIA